MCVCVYVYVCVPQERKDRLEQARQMEQQVQHRRCVEELFQLWDVNHSGFIDLNDFINIFVKWKGFEDEETLSQGKHALFVVPG